MDEITTTEQLKDVIARSQSHPVFIFKHSTACPISFGAHRRVTDYLKKAEKTGGSAPEFHLIKVIESRPVSQAVEKELGVPHKSPQLLLLHGGRCRWHTSHYDITADRIEKALQVPAE